MLYCDYAVQVDDVRREMTKFVRASHLWDGRKMSLQVVDTTERTVLGQVAGLGDLSHATVVFSRDERYAYVFGRDGGLTQVDILQRRVVKRVLQSGNSIGGAISQDGRIIAAANYTPGGVKLFRSDTLEQVADPSGQPRQRGLPGGGAVDAVTGQVGRQNPVAVRLQGGNHLVPAPAAMPCPVDENIGAHRCPLNSRCAP